MNVDAEFPTELLQSLPTCVLDAVVVVESSATIERLFAVLAYVDH